MGERERERDVFKVGKCDGALLLWEIILKVFNFYKFQTFCYQILSNSTNNFVTLFKLIEFFLFYLNIILCNDFFSAPTNAIEILCVFFF